MLLSFRRIWICQEDIEINDRERTDRLFHMLQERSAKTTWKRGTPRNNWPDRRAAVKCNENEVTSGTTYRLFLFSAQNTRPTANDSMRLLKQHTEGNKGRKIEMQLPMAAGSIILASTTSLQGFEPPQEIVIIVVITIAAAIRFGNIRV